MVSISDDARASCSAKLSISMAWLGMRSAMPFNSASARLAAIAFFKTVVVSTSAAGGSGGKSLKGALRSNMAVGCVAFGRTSRGLAEAVPSESPAFTRLAGAPIGKPIMRPINSSLAPEAGEPDCYTLRPRRNGLRVPPKDSRKRWAVMRRRELL